MAKKIVLVEISVKELSEEEAVKIQTKILDGFDDLTLACSGFPDKNETDRLISQISNQILIAAGDVPGMIYFVKKS